MSLSIDSCNTSCKELRKLRNQELFKFLSQNEPEDESSSMSFTSLSSEGSDVTAELIIERSPPENKHDDPPEVYFRLDELVQQLCREKHNTHHELISFTHEDLNDIQSRNREEFIRISVEDYNDFGCKRFRTSTPSPAFSNNDLKNMDINDDDDNEHNDNDEELVDSDSGSNETQLSQYYVKKDGVLRRVEVNNSEVQVDLKNAWQSIKKHFFQECHSFKIHKFK